MEDNNETLIAILKVVFMLAFFAIVMIVGTLPIRSSSFKTNPKLRLIGSTLAGALFINVAILHILPESADTLETRMKEGDEDKEVFPVANLLMMVGFLVTVFLTKVITRHDHDHEGHGHDEPKTAAQEANIQQGLLSGNSEENIASDSADKANLKSAVVLTFAMYFHTLFEGIAIGLQSGLSDFLSIALAIAFHKWADALSMGCHYRSKNVSKKAGVCLIAGQAVLNVIAIGIGWAISLSGELAEAICLAISAGTFLAISTTELLTEQLSNRQSIYLKFLLLILATGFISAVWFVENDLFQ